MHFLSITFGQKIAHSLGGGPGVIPGDPPLQVWTKSGSRDPDAMRRKLQLIVLLLLLAGTTESGIRASTDCERWLAAYKAELAHTKAVKRLAAANARVKRAAKRKIAKYVKKPKPAAPKLVRVHSVRPRYTRQQMLDRFNLICGDLPGISKVSDKLMDGGMTPVEMASESVPFVPFEMADLGGTELIPLGEAPPYVPSSVQPDIPSGGSGGGAPVFGGGGGGGGFTSSAGGGGDSSGSGGTGGTGGAGGSSGGGGDNGGGGGTGGGGGVAVVPEPDSVLLLLTGIAGMAGVVRRKISR